MNRKSLLMMAALTVLTPVALSGCASTASSGRPADLTFAQMAPLELNVGAMHVVNQTQPSGNPRVSPAAALTNYANRRLKAVGGEGTLNFVIQQASLTSAESQGTGNWTDALQLSKPMEYTVTMRVGLDLVERTTRPNVRSAFTLERKKTLPAGASLADRDREINQLIEAMVRDMDTAVQRGLAENMKILVTPGALTFGTPAPLDSSGAMVVDPGPAIRNPVVIQGRMD